MYERVCETSFGALCAETALFASSVEENEEAAGNELTCETKGDSRQKRSSSSNARVLQIGS